MKHLQIRKAQLKDLSAIAAVNLSAFGNPSHPYSLRQNFDLFGETYLVAELDDVVVGYCLSAIQPKTNNAWILDLAVLAERQGSGIGKRLTEAACKLLRTNGVETVYLTVNPNKDYLRVFYEGFGFVIDHEEKAYFGPGNDRLVMRARL